MPSISLKNVIPLHRWHKANFVAGFLLLSLSVTPVVQTSWLPSNMLGVLGLALMSMGLGDWTLIRTRLKNERSSVEHTDWFRGAGHGYETRAGALWGTS